LDSGADIDFVLTLRRRWADRLYPALRRDFDAVADPAAIADRVAAGEVTRALPLFPWFAWMERGSQKMMWRAVERAVADEPPPTLPAAPKGTLELHPEVTLPDWYTDWDIHVQPGGVWQTDLSARIYEMGAKLVMLGANDDYLFHRRFVETCLTPLDGRKVTRLIDLGCGFGKSTWPLKKAFPGAEIIGLDLAVPCLRLAHAKAEAQGLAIRFIQADSAASGLEAGSADLVTATMLIHELPRPALTATIKEAARLLKPGGILRFLDFRYTGDGFRDFAMHEHGARNNEPFMPSAMVADTAGLCAAAGLAKAQWVAFDERGGGRIDRLAWPTRAEWHFPWAVLEAEKT
jgi:SAM-dependent methyltransferase